MKSPVFLRKAQRRRKRILPLIPILADINSTLQGLVRGHPVTAASRALGLFRPPIKPPVGKRCPGAQHARAPTDRVTPRNTVENKHERTFDINYMKEFSTLGELNSQYPTVSSKKTTIEHEKIGEDAGERRTRPRQSTPHLRCCSLHQKFSPSSRCVAAYERACPPDKQRLHPSLQPTYSTTTMPTQTSKHSKAD
ncbi:hypothetical protein EVAR_93870_1 [Eumeta japonica]|uniref:Uncharacterized protein n=1 Tax=Eumeta variegata TaxID=151549 RepID=A0A4C1TWM9_EUMVA|nr:hypothetical protein EVAR_93870_1 [Eumeta japonica]